MTRRPSVTESTGRSEPPRPELEPTGGIDYDIAPGLGAVDEGEVTIEIVPHPMMTRDKIAEPREDDDANRSHDVA